MGSGSLTANSVPETAADFENFSGRFADIFDISDITGTGRHNAIAVYGNGSTTLHALGGNDRIQGDNGDDLMHGGVGEDTADGAPAPTPVPR
jgi:hypothetical protein